jgi:hypothetical protein
VSNVWSCLGSTPVAVPKDSSLHWRTAAFLLKAFEPSGREWINHEKPLSMARAWGQSPGPRCRIIARSSLSMAITFFIRVVRKVAGKEGPHVIWARASRTKPSIARDAGELRLSHRGNVNRSRFGTRRLRLSQFVDLCMGMFERQLSGVRIKVE